MAEPPERLDGADVLCWVASSREEFYQMVGADPPIKVAAMVVAQYADGGPIYLFKCDREWQVVQDWDCSSIEEAQALAIEHAFGEQVVWRTRVGPETGAIAESSAATDGRKQ